MAVKRLKFANNAFISDDGTIFEIINGKEHRIEMKIKKNRTPYFFYNDIRYDLINIMIECFIGPISFKNSIKYTVTKDLRIPLNSIRILDFTGKFGLTEHDEKLLYDYKCDDKAWSSNYRGIGILSPVQVYLSLKTHNYRCYYCNKKFPPRGWHLDHYIPISKGGRNEFANIVPACRRCNLMKGGLDPTEFVSQCIKISEHLDISTGSVNRKFTINPLLNIQHNG